MDVASLISSTAILLSGIGLHLHIMLVLNKLFWLPVHFVTQFKILFYNVEPFLTWKETPEELSAYTQYVPTLALHLPLICGWSVGEKATTSCGKLVKRLLVVSLILALIELCAIKSVLTINNHTEMDLLRDLCRTCSSNLPIVHQLSQFTLQFHPSAFEEREWNWWGFAERSPRSNAEASGAILAKGLEHIARPWVELKHSG